MNYFEFVKELSLKNNKTFKEQLMNPETKKLWNQVRPVKTRVSRVKAKNIANQQGITQEAPGIKVDLSRAKIVPATVQQEPDRILDYYNQRWSNFVNTIDVNRFISLGIYTGEKRPKELKPYNLTPINYLLNGKRAIYEDSPLSFELSSYIFNPRTFFNNIRNIKIIRNDKLRISSRLKDITSINSVDLVGYDFEENRQDNLTLFQQVSKFKAGLWKYNYDLNLMYLNDMLYDKNTFYSLIFLYGGYLSTDKQHFKDKNLIVVTSRNMGEGVGGFYSRLDSGYFNSSLFPIGLQSADPTFNFSNIVRYLSGKSGETLIQSVDNPQGVNTDGKPVKPVKPVNPQGVNREIPTESVPISTPVQAVSSLLVTEAVPSGFPNFLYEPFQYKPDEQLPNQDPEFSKRIYFRLGKGIDYKNDKFANKNLKVGDFVYHDKYYISQIMEVNKNQQLKIAFFYTDPNNKDIMRVTQKTLTSAAKSKIRPVQFVSKDFKHNAGVYYTSLKNMAIDQFSTYNKVKGYFYIPNNKFEFIDFIFFQSS